MRLDSWTEPAWMVVGPLGPAGKSVLDPVGLSPSVVGT